MKNSDNFAKQTYDAAMGGQTEDTTKGVHLGQRPYLWREDNPVEPFVDTPCENFVPTPTMNSGEDSKKKRIVKYVLIGLFVAFMIYAFIAILNDNSSFIELGKRGKGHFFG